MDASNSINLKEIEPWQLIDEKMPKDTVNLIFEKLFPQQISDFVSVCKSWNKVGIDCVWNLQVIPLQFLIERCPLSHPMMSIYPEEKGELSVNMFKETPNSLLDVVRMTTSKVFAIARCLIVLSDDEKEALLTNATSHDKKNNIQRKRKYLGLLECSSSFSLMGGVLPIADGLKLIEEANQKATPEDKSKNLSEAVVCLNNGFHFCMDKACEVLRDISSPVHLKSAISSIVSSYPKKRHLLEIIKHLPTLSKGEDEDIDDCFYQKIIFALVDRKMFEEALSMLTNIHSEEVLSECLEKLGKESYTLPHSLGH